MTADGSFGTLVESTNVVKSRSVGPTSMTTGHTVRAVAAASVIAMLLLATAPVSDAATVENTDVRAPSVDFYADVPSSFDMRDHYTVTPVKDQGIYQMCDFFATAACLEQLLLLEGYGERDLSELFIAGSVFTGYGEPSGDGGDEMWTTVYPSDYIFGSYSWLSALCLIDWRSAPIADGLAPVTDFTQDYVSDPGLLSEAIARITGFKVLDPQVDADAVKSMIMAGYAGSMMIDASGYTVMNGEMTCNVPWDSAINHTVAVVGWDDDYPKENFYLQPESDGAWLVKNSFGTSFGTYDGDGYMWVSYESFIAPIVLFYDSCEPASDSRHLYSYDHGSSIGSDMAFEGSATAANVFTATADQVLDAVSFTTFSMSDATYSVQVYVDLRDPSDPTSGTPALGAPVTGEIWAAGAYMVDLGTEVDLEEGVTFSVVVTFEGDGTVYVPLDTDEDEVLMGVPEYYCRPVASAGESFVLSDDGWVDVSADGTTNVRIKAYATDSDDGTSMIGAAVAVAVVAIVAAIAWLAPRR